jgi:small subunit ribosomal protein S20
MMPNIKSQKERVRLAAKQTARNKSARSALRTTVKKANASIEAHGGNMPETVKKAAAALEKAGGKKLIHPNTASRKVSRIMKKANAAPAQ